MESNRTSYIKKYDKILIYVTVYTIAFFLFVKTLPYTIPFVLAFSIAAIVSPIVKKLVLWTKNKINENFLILLTLLSFYGLLGTLIASLIVRLVNQSILLVTNTISYLTITMTTLLHGYRHNTTGLPLISRLLTPVSLKPEVRCLQMPLLHYRKSLLP